MGRTSVILRRTRSERSLWRLAKLQTRMLTESVRPMHSASASRSSAAWHWHLSWVPLACQCSCCGFLVVFHGIVCLWNWANVNPFVRMHPLVNRACSEVRQTAAGVDPVSSSEHLTNSSPHSDPRVPDELDYCGCTQCMLSGRPPNGYYGHNRLLPAKTETPLCPAFNES